MTAPVRVGVRVTSGLREWAGGYNYVRNLLHVLQTYSRDRVQPVLFAGPEVTQDDVGELALLVDESVAIDAAWGAATPVRIARTIIAGSDHRAARSLSSIGVDVVLEQGAFYGRSFPIPTLVWMADFQHCYLPEMFGQVGAFKRELVSRLKVAGERTIMVSSHAARADCAKFYRVPDARIRVVPFAVLPTSASADPAAVRAQYGIPDHFFFLPNQLWKHKNHRLVCEALSLLQRRGQRVCVVASGSTFDPRNPSLYNDLRALVASERIEQNFRHLGMIPYSHVAALLRAAAALINPSLFEGWSTTVEEAKSFGVPLILSDIPVHREQAPPGSLFFDPTSADQLAGVLLGARERLSPGPRPQAEELARVETPDRAGRFARDFEAAVQTALAAG